MAKEVHAHVSMDMSSLEKGMKKLISDIGPRAIAPGLFKAGNALLGDAIYKSKTAPKEVGDLWGSASTQGATGGPKKISGGVSQTGKAIESGNELHIFAGFNIEYAAKWHEVSPAKNIAWTTDRGSTDPGPKYLESKMGMFRSDYIEILGLYVKRLLAGSSGEE